jgi:hypothetical protein
MTLTAKKRVNINIDSDLHARATALTDQLPGASFSWLVSLGLQSAVPAFEQVLEAAKTGDTQALLQVLQLTTAQGMEDAGVAMADLRKKIKEGETTFDPSKFKK